MFLPAMLSLSLVLPVQQSSTTYSLPEVLVVSRKAESVLDLPLSASVLTVDDAIQAHPNEIFDEVPGTWISRGSGQEHLTAIRSPVLTGAGACGAFLYLENQVPIRPAGFCNVNNLFELNLEQAATAEVIRGPGSALYGSNALHGAINVEMQTPADGGGLRLSVGENDYRRADLSYGIETQSGWGLLAQTSLSSIGSFRDNEGFDQQKFYLSWQKQESDWSSHGWLSATNLNQETAGFIFGEDAYLDPVARRSNVNPEAFRDADSLRIGQRWNWSGENWDYQLTPYARRSRMAFLQHFLPGQPLEENGHESIGVQWLARQQNESWSFSWGADLEWSDGFLREIQAEPLTTGSAFLQETRPVGVHYDYQVQSALLAAFAEVDWEFSENWQLAAGLRAETLRYDYDNFGLDGNTRDDGTVCGFGGCLYTRPADRDDSFTELAPRLSLSRQLSRSSLAYLRLARGFRAPQATELYRLQQGQTVADLEPEKLDTVELGYKANGTNWTLGVAAYYLKKRNFIFRDSEGFNVSDGRTRHRGVEVDWQWAPNEDWQVQAAAAFQRQTYAFLRDLGRGEVILPGNDIDTAPETLASVSVQRNLGERFALSAQWRHQGSYELNASNTARYPGHDLLDLGFNARLTQNTDWQLQLFNATNRRYAERADFAFGNFRYFPGQGRTLLLTLDYQL